MPRGDRRRHGDHRDAHRRRDGASAPGTWRGSDAACWPTSAAAAPPTGTCGCWRACSTSTRCACTRAARRAATRSPRACAPTSACAWSWSTSWEECVRGADIVVEATPPARAASRCCAPSGSRRGALVVPYGTMSAVELDADRRHGQGGRRRLGPGRRRARSARCAARRHRPADRARRCTRSSARSSPGGGPAASRRRDDLLLAPRPVDHATSPSATRCWRRPRRLGVGQRLRFA